MLGPITLLALREMILTMEADRHGLGWSALPASMYVVSIQGRFLRHQALPRPSGLAATNPPHVHGTAYAATGGAAPLTVTGGAVAACFIAERCPGCLRSRLPRPVHRA